MSRQIQHRNRRYKIILAPLPHSIIFLKAGLKKFLRVTRQAYSRCTLWIITMLSTKHTARPSIQPYAVPPTVNPSIRSVGWPTPTGTLCPSFPHVPTPESISMSLPIMLTRVSTSGPLPMRVAPFTG